MTNFKATTRAEAGRKLAIVERDISVEASKLNCKRIMPLLLCLDDAVDNLQTELLKSNVLENKFQTAPGLLLDLVQFVMGFYQTIDDMITAISQNGFWDSTTKIELPKIAFGVCIEEDLDRHLSTLYQERKIGRNAAVFQKRHLFLNRISGYFYIILEQDHSKHALENMTHILSLRDLFYQKGLLEAMIHTLPEGSEVEFGDGGLMKVTYPEDVTCESILEETGLSLRSLEASTAAVQWNSYFQEICLENLRLNSLKGKENIDNLREESQEIYRAYHSMKDFSIFFGKLYGIDLKVFSSILAGMIDICYQNTHTVGVWQFSEFLNQMKLLGKFDPRELEIVIELLSNSTELRGFIKIHESCFTNFRRLALSELAILERCFDEFYDKNLKGKAFEKASRELLERRGLKTIPKNVEIFEPMLPTDISLLLWGKQKKRTDIDAIATRDNQIFIVECKQSKVRSHELHERNQFRKYAIELYYKAKWILSNFGKFKEYVGNANWGSLHIDEGSSIYLFPLIITNKAVNVAEGNLALVVTYNELKKILAHEWCVKSQEKTGTIEVEVENRKIRLLWLRR